MAILGFLATRLLAAGVGKSIEQARSIAAIGLVFLLVLALVGGGCLWLRSHDRAVVKADDLQERVEGAERDLRGSNAAGAAVAGEEAKFQAEQADIVKGQTDAVAKNPEGAGRAVGPSSQSYYDRLRSAQAADRQNSR